MYAATTDLRTRMCGTTPLPQTWQAVVLIALLHAPTDIRSEHQRLGFMHRSSLPAPLRGATPTLPIDALGQLRRAVPHTPGASVFGS